MSESNTETHDQVDSGDSYFISMTDMMVGMLFVFIIMLMAFALNYRDTTSRLTENKVTREEILEQLKQTLKERGVRVDIDPERGVMRLPEKILFESGKAELNVPGQRALSFLADALIKVLPCYSRGSSQSEIACSNKGRATVEAMLIEGHTDNVPLARGASYLDNWALSVSRAIVTYKALVAAAPQLDELVNTDGQRMLSVSGYADRRPVKGKDFKVPTSEAENRRIDLRFIMSTPSVVQLDR